MKIELQDNIDDYLLNRMSDDERVLFEAELASDSELQEQLKFTEDVRNAIRSRNEILAKMKEWEAEYKREEQRNVAAAYRATGSGYDCCSAPAPNKNIYKEKPLRTKRIILWSSGVAAVFIAGLFMVRALFFTGDNLGYDTYFTQEGMFRSGSDYSDIDSMLKLNRYEDALLKIEEEFKALYMDSLEISSDMQLDAEQRDYKLMQVKELRDDLKWMEIHALLGLNRMGEALRLLNELRVTEGYYKESAESLYNRMKK